MTNRLQKALAAARLDDRGILLGYLPAGYPSRDSFFDCAHAAFDAGLDALEVGMPGPAPDLDGPIIRKASRRAAEQTSSVSGALELATRSRHSPTDVVVAMAYRHTLDGLGEQALLDELTRHDIDALLMPELDMTEQLRIGQNAQICGIEPVLFLHLEQDLGLLAECSIERPVIYLQSADMGTGSNFQPAKVRERMTELRAALAGREAWVLVGFGVRNLADVDVVMRAGADGAIIGTALVVAAGDGPAAVRELVESARPALARHASGSRV